jgi:putative transposase
LSSHKAHCDEEIIPWLTTNWVLSQFSEDKQQAINAFRNFVMDGMRDGHREEFHKGSGGGNRLLGNDSFIDKVIGTAERKAKQALTLENLLDHVCRRYLIDPSALKKPGKDRSSRPASLDAVG